MIQTDRDALHILRDALDTDPGQRDRFLSMRCGADTRLRKRVDTMLRGIAQEDPTDPVGEGPDSVPPREPVCEDPLVGSLLGPFRVVERIGRGGMGIVYRGEREGADFAQQVAIKLIRRGFDFDDVQARFVRERRILARLAHPNLARFIDGGVACDGRPWFALEYVRGSSITRWCDSRRCSIRDRVRVFLDVCAAVQYAHTQLIVHRDIKPENVLVDEAGSVHLLDFGIARLLSGDGNASGELPTVTGSVAWTPEFASPEQMAGAEVGVASDVFALGVLLYLLLADALPYDVVRGDVASMRLDAYEKPPVPLAQAIIVPRKSSGMRSGRTEDSDPSPLQLSSNTALLPHQATRADDRDRQSGIRHRLEARSTTLAVYRRTVRGDLQRIVETALAREPERRYQTVAAFAEDLQRWLLGAPVRVSGNRFSYRLGKFVRRNAASVTVATILVLALTGATAWALRNAASERHQQEVASREAARTLEIKDQLIQLFLQPEDPALGTGGKSAREFLEQAAARLQALPVGSNIRGELAGVLVGIYLNFSQHERALALAETELGGIPVTAQTTAHADLRLVTDWAMANWINGRVDGVSAPLASAIAHASDTHSKIYADALLMQTRMAIETRDFAGAIRSGQHALQLFLENGASTSDIVSAHQELSAAYVGNRQPRKGREESERALRDAGSADSVMRVHATTMAGLRRALFGEFASAQSAFDDGAAQWKRLGLTILLPFENTSYAVNRFDLGEVDQSAVQIQIAVSTKEFSERPWLLGEIALHRRKYDAAAAHFAEAATIAKRSEARFQPMAIYMLALQSVALSRAGDLANARHVLDMAQGEAQGAPHADFATSMLLGAQAVLLSSERHYAPALATFDRALAELAAARKAPAVLEDQLKENRDALRLRIWNAQAQLAAGKTKAAEKTASAARQLGLATLGAQHPFMRELEDVERRLRVTD